MKKMEFNDLEQMLEVYLGVCVSVCECVRVCACVQEHKVLGWHDLHYFPFMLNS